MASAGTEDSFRETPWSALKASLWVVTQPPGMCPCMLHVAWMSCYTHDSILTFRPCSAQALALEANHEKSDPSSVSGADDQVSTSNHEATEVMSFYEITVASVDQPKLLSRLSEALVSGSSRSGFSRF